MTTIPNTQGTVSRPRLRDCPAGGNVTRSLLGYLTLAGPCYVLVSLAQALARPGFSLTRDEWSLLALGPMGWIQMINLIVTGAMTVAGAIGVRRCLGRSAHGGVWAPRLLAGYGVALTPPMDSRPGRLPGMRTRSAGTGRCICWPGRPGSAASSPCAS